MPGIVIKIGVDAAKALSNLDKVEKSLKRSLTPAEKFTGVVRKMGPALGAAAAAAGVFAVAVGVDAVKAAIAEEDELAQLNKTLDNLGFADASDDVNKFIDDLQYSANVADTELRKSYSTLARATGDLTLTQSGLQTALDISASTGKDLDTVVAALSKAYAGNKGALGKLNVGLDAAWLKTASMQEIMAELSRTMGGAGAVKAGTLAGSIEGVTIAVDELKEAFGQGLVGNVDGTTASLADAEATLRRLQPTAQQAGADVNKVAVGALTAYDNFTTFYDALEAQDWETVWGVISAGARGADDEMANLTARTRDAALAFEYLQYAAYNSAQATKSAWTTVGNVRFRAAGAGTDWAATDERLRGARLRYGWQQADAANARRAAKRAAKRQAAADARAAKIADRKHAARTGTKATSPKPGKRSC